MKNLQIQFVILLAFLLAYYIRFDNFLLEASYIIALLSGMLSTAVIMPTTGAFRSVFRWAFFRKVRRLLAGWALVVVSLITLAASFKVTADYSRVWFGYWVLFTGFGLIISQLLEYAWQIYRRSHYKSTKRIVLICEGRNGRGVEQHILTDQTATYDVVAKFGDCGSNGDIYALKDLAEFVESENIGEVWIAIPGEATKLLKKILDALNNVICEVNIVPDLQQYRLLNQNISDWDGLPVVNLSGTPLTGTELWMKAIFDRVCAFVLIILLSPVFTLLILLIRLSSSGPALFRQKRAGMGGEVIDIIKFRSMKVSDRKFIQATPGDDRVTPIGKFLRRTSLDELPQLLNVVSGNMSLVGPRPHPIELNEQFMARIPRYMLRHKVKPGITGWAQVNGYRGITDTDDKMALRIEHDLWYIQNWSIWLDVKIIFQTPFCMIHRNAF